MSMAVHLWNFVFQDKLGKILLYNNGNNFMLHNYTFVLYFMK